MKTWYYLLSSAIVVIIFLFATGCAVYKAPIVPPCGGIYTHFKAPCSTKYKGTTVEGKKTYGDSVARYLREPFLQTSYGWGDASIQTIAERNGIKKIEYVDYEYLNVLGFYQQFKVIPHGE